MTLRIWALAAIAFLPLGSMAQAFEVTADGGNEFAVPIPKGFEHVFSDTDPIEIHEFVPHGESMTNWSEMITISSLSGTYIDANGALKDYASIKLLAYIGNCSDALMEPVLEPGRVSGRVSFSTSFGCITKPEVREIPQIDVRPFEFLSVTYVQGDDKVYEVQRAVHFDALTQETLPAALEQNNVNLQYTKTAMGACCGK